MTENDVSVRITIKNSGNLLAQATVIFLGVVEIKGWRVMSSTKVHPQLQELIWIQSPCYKVGSSWKPIVFIDNKELYSKVEEKIYSSYKDAKRRTPFVGVDGLREEVRVEDIPF